MKNKALLIPLVILLGIVIGFQLKETSSHVSTKIDKIPKRQKIKELHTPKYLSEQIINHKKEYQENRPTPKDKNEEIVAYYEDSIAKEFDKNVEVYEENGTIYINLNGKLKAIASQKDTTTPMIPKLSASKQFIAYQWYDEKSQRYEVIVESLLTHKKEILEDAVSYTWHPHRDVLVYDGSQEDDGHSLLKSEIYLFQPYNNTIVQLTDTSEFVETHPIFSEDGNDIYSDDEKTGRLLYFNMYPILYQTPFMKQVKMYKTARASLNIEEIKKHSQEFKKIDKDEKFSEKEMTYWIEIELDKTMKSGIYGGYTHPFIFDKNSFSTKQLDVNISNMMIYQNDDRYSIKFNYQAGVDETRYYFRLKSFSVPPPFKNDLFKIEPIQPYVEASDRKTTYCFYKKYFIETILSSLVIGMILMSALYTAVIYVYRRKKEFLYYTLMQISMSIFLFTAPMFFRGVFSLDFISMQQLTLIVAFFATLFTQSFLDTKKHLPKIDLLLNLYLLLIVADAIWIFDPILLKYKLYEFFGLLFLLSAMLRIKNGFKPAWFYLLGWLGLLLCLFLMDFYHFSNFTMFIGVFIEAVMLAWGLVYVSGFGDKNHEK